MLPFKRLQAGGALDGLPAADWNRFIAAARWVETQQRALGAEAAGRPQPNPVIVRIKNTSEEDIPAGGILGINQPTSPPPDEHLSANTLLQIDLRGVKPTVEHRGSFVVTLDVVKKNAVGRAVISGACWVKVSKTEAIDFPFAITGDSTSSLEAAAAGPARIIWRQTGTGEKWAIVRLGTCESCTKLVDLAADGGAAGSNPMNRTYKVLMRDTSFIIAEGQSPAYRPHAGRAGDATEGLASFDDDGVFIRLELAYESLTRVTC